MCTKFGENPSSGLGEIKHLRFIAFKEIRGHNSENTYGTKYISLHVNLHISTSMCTTFGENQSRGVGGDALTRRWT